MAVFPPVQGFNPTTQPYITAKDLLRRSGWNKWLISKLLGEPDAVVTKHLPMRSFQMRVFSRDRVEAAESSEEWATWDSSSYYVQRRKRRVETTASLEDRVRLFDIKVKHTDLPLDKLTELAWESGQDRLRRKLGERYQRKELRSADSSTVSRLLCGYLRHNLTNYDQARKILIAEHGSVDAYIQLRSRVYDALRKAFPVLKEVLDADEVRTREYAAENYEKYKAFQERYDRQLNQNH